MTSGARASPELFTCSAGAHSPPQTSSSAATSDELSTFVNQLATASGVSLERFVDLNSSSADASSSAGGAIILLRLRPPFRPQQQSNSYAMQAIRRTVRADGNFTAYGSVQVVDLASFVIYRGGAGRVINHRPPPALQGDGNARRLSLRIDRSFKDVVANATETALSWTAGLALQTRINGYRLKNPMVAMGG